MNSSGGDQPPGARRQRTELHFWIEVFFELLQLGGRFIGQGSLA